MNTVLIVRGRPGVGKTTWIQNNFGAACPTICSADDFLTVNSEYTYDPSKIEAAHDYCFDLFHESLRQERPLVIVDNVMHRLWNVSPYMRVAKTFKYDCRLFHIYCPDHMEAFRRCQHEVPREKFEWLVKDFERAPKAWAEKKYRSGQTYHL
jgi:predicted kinase